MKTDSQIRVLYVDDSAFDRALVRDALEVESEGFHLTEAAEREDLERILADDPVFDLVLSDFNILGMTGLDVLVLVREVLPDVPIIIVTGTGSEEIAVQALKSGADDYVIKQPSHIRRLPQTIHSVLETRRARAERDRARTLLEESEFRFRLLAEHSMDLILRLDPQGRVLYASPASIELLGQEPATLVGRDFLGLVHEDHHTAIGEELSVGEDLAGQVANAGPQVLGFPPFRLRGDGSRVIWVEARGRVIDRAHTLSGVVEVQLACRDITERKEMEANLQVSRERLRQLRHLESVARLAGGIAHDFNNLLTVISGNIELIGGELDPDHSLEGEIAEVRAATRRAGELTRHLLDFSSGRMAPLSVVDPREILEETGSLLRRALDESIELEVEVPEALPPVRSNPARLQQVLMNLGLNAEDAIHATDRGGRISIRADEWTPEAPDPRADTDLRPWLPSQGEAPLLRIRVVDDGCGMEAEVAARVFEPFFTTKEVGKGTGLGLASSFGTVRQSGGTILVDSVPDEGTTFTVLLPIHRARSNGGP